MILLSFVSGLCQWQKCLTLNWGLKKESFYPLSNQKSILFTWTIITVVNTEEKQCKSSLNLIKYIYLLRFKLQYFFFCLKECLGTKVNWILSCRRPVILKHFHIFWSVEVQKINWFFSLPKPKEWRLNYVATNHFRQDFKSISSSLF